MGVYGWNEGKGERFEWSVCRQFIVYAGGAYDSMEHLRCDLYFEVTPELVGLGSGDIWSGPDKNEWIDEVEAIPGFDAMLSAQILESRFGQHDV
jgi:hypothetical protein